MKILRYNLDNKKIWNEFLDNSKNGLFMFDRDFMDYHSDRFSDYSLMIYDDKDKLIALLPANEKDGVLYSHQGLTFGGFIINNKMNTQIMLNIFDEIKKYLLSNNFFKIVYKSIPYIYHKQPAQEDLYALQINGAKLSRVDVSTTIDLENKISFSSLRKRGVKKAQKNDVTVQQSKKIEEYMKLLSSVLSSLHNAKPVHTIDEMKLLISRFPKNIKLFTAQKDSDLLAGVVVFEYKHIVHAQYICTSSDGRDVGALDAVFSYLINDIYCDKKYFDFGISTENHGMLLNENLIRQKEGFGGRAIVHQFFEIELR